MKVYTLNQYRRRLRRLENQIQNGDEPVYNSSRYGAMMAAKLAPVETGALINNIHFKKSKTNQAWILQKNPGHQNPARYGRAKGKPFNYAYAMMFDGKTRRNIHSGNPDYMKESARLTKSKFKTNVLAHVRRTINTTK